MANPTNPTHEPASILGPTLRFKGELHAEEDILIRGQVEGSITHSQRLTVCCDGRVKANITGQVIAVEGTVEGDLNASSSVTLLGTSNVKGDVRAPSVSVVVGARFNGSVDMEQAEAAQRESVPEPQPAAAPEPARKNPPW